MTDRHRVRRLIAAGIVGIVGVAPLAATAQLSAAPAGDDVIAQGAALAAAAVAVGNVDPDVDLWPLYSESSIDNQSSHGLSGAVWPGFLLDAFAWLYDLQPQERGGLAISESQWPNPPHSSYGSSSGFMFEQFAAGCAQFFDPAQCTQAFESFTEPPGALGVSESHSGELTSNGMARFAQFDIPGLLESTEAWSRTNSRFEGGRAIVESVFTAKDITIGTDLHIDTIEARSTAIAGGTKESSDGSSTLRIVGARFGDTPIVIDSQGAHGTGDEGTDSLNDLLADEGLELRLSQGHSDVDGNGEFVDSATGGLLLRVVRERVEEDLPEPLVAGKQQLCAAADNALSQEITRIRVDQPNPFYGQIPLTPERVQLEQSIPPPVGCPFLNRNFDVTIALGLTNAQARLSPLPVIESGLTDVVDIGEVADVIPPVVSGLGTNVAGTLMEAPTEVGTHDDANLVSGPITDGVAARRLKIVYGVLLLLAALGIAGRFALRAVSAP